MMRKAYTFMFPVLLLAVLSVGLVFPVSATKGSYPGDNGKIVFTDEDPAPPYDSEIFVMDNDGGNIQQLTFNDVEDRNPCWSPDGAKIAFQHGDYGSQEIWVMDADGSNPRQLTAHAGGIADIIPAWSPDGGKIAFTRSISSSFDVYVVDANDPAGWGTLLISGPAFSTSWSPDGSEIVYHETAGISVADASTGTFKRALGEGYDPCWSPDGTKIVFVRGDEIWVMNTDGSNRQQLSDPPQQPMEYEDGAPNWSPDGEKIVFGREEDSIWIMNADGSNEFDLTPSLPSADEPDYQRITLAPVGGVIFPINKFEVITPYLVLVGLIAGVSTVYVFKKHKD
jgi:TolB protein